MSHKGAIRKASTSRDRKDTNIKSKLTISTPTTESGDSENVDIKLRTSISHERTKGSDNFSKLTHNVQSSKNSTKLNIKSSKSTPIKESSSVMVKSNVNNSKVLSKGTLPSKSSIDLIRKSSGNHSIKSNKSISGRTQSSYSEKRGLSTIFVPQSITSKLSAKSTGKETTSVSKSEAQIRTHSNLSNVPEATESKTKSRQRRLSRTLSPSEVKMLHIATNVEAALQSTIKSRSNQPQPSEIGNEYDYEDDFEDYESDFQECTDSETSEVSEETSLNHNNINLDPIELHMAKQRKVVNSIEQKEEEHMHDSGHYELAEARKRAARMESIVNDPKLSSLLEIKQPINKSYSEDRSENKSLPLSTDEGFEDSRSGDFAKSPPQSQISFIDFRKSEENKKLKESRKTLNRGEVLLEMIKLDVMEWSLLECSPIPYEDFIRCYGKLNTQQMFTQTGEDNIDVDTQTDEILNNNKWTQFPITCRSNLKSKGNLSLFQMDQVGVGTDSDVETISSIPSPSFDILRLSDFMNRAGRVMLCLLEERRSGGNVLKNEKKIPFSDGAVKLSIDSVTFLAGRAVTIIHYSEVLNKILLTIHSPVEEEIETSSRQDYITDCCIGCVWNIFEPSMPIKLFYSACPITACCFHSTNYSVVFAGLQDGSISLWDLKEDEMWHHKVADNANKLNWTIRIPTYTTATCLNSDTYTSQIVALRAISKIEKQSLEQRNTKFIPIQICSLNENGSLIIWSVLQNMGKSVGELGLSFWGSIKLVKSQELHLQSHSQKKKINAATFIDMHVDCIDNNCLYIITNSSNILRTTCIGNKLNPAVYTKLDASSCGNVTCIDTCPFEESFFLVSCDDGTIRLHSINTEKPILQLRDEDNVYAIKAVQWSRSKPFIIFILDNNSCIHVWDLSNSDIYPTHTVNMQQNGCITSIQLSSCKIKQDMSHQYLAFGTESGNVEIHKLKQNFYCSKKEDYLQEVNTFKRYVSIS